MQNRPLNLETVIGELEERKKRSRNVILFGIQESTAVDVDARKNHDMDLVSKSLSSLPEQVKPINVIRLGKQQPNATRPRPIKLIFANKQKAFTCIKK